MPPLAGAIPKQMLNALPLLTADQAAIGGNVTAIGGTLYRIFTPDALGINGVSVNQDVSSLQYYLATPYLDLRACHHFVLTVRCNNPAGHGLLTGLSVNVQWRQGPTDTPALFYVNAGVKYFQNQTMTVMAKSGAAVTPATITTEGQTYVAAWSTIQPGSSFATDGNMLTTGGANCRLILTSGSTAIAPANIFTAWLEAST